MNLNPENAINFYSDIRYQQRYVNDDGYQIIASNRFLVPFSFSIADAPQTVNKFSLVYINNGAIIDLDTALVNVKRNSTSSRSWYYFNGVDIGAFLDCGAAYIVVKIGSQEYFSDVMTINVIGTPETLSISLIASTGSTVRLQATHIINTAIINAYAQYQVNGSGNWINAPTTINISTDTVTFELPNPIPGGYWYKVKYTTLSDFKVSIERVFTLYFDSSNPVGVNRIEYLQDATTIGKNVFEITAYHPNDYNQNLYSKGWKQKIYVLGSFGFPEENRKVEIEENGNGDSFIVSSQLRQKLTLNLTNVPDCYLHLLSEMSSHDYIDIVDLTTGRAFYGVKEVDFTYSIQEGGYYSRGVLKFQQAYSQRGACLDNYGAVNV